MRFAVVKQHVARNPVARAMSRVRVKRAVTDFLLHTYMIEHGTVQAESILMVSKLIAVACRVLDARGESASPDARVMAGAMSAMAQCSERKYVWRQQDAPAIDAGVTRARDVLEGASAREARDAWAYVEAL